MTLLRLPATPVVASAGFVAWIAWRFAVGAVEPGRLAAGGRSAGRGRAGRRFLRLHGRRVRPNAYYRRRLSGGLSRYKRAPWGNASRTLGRYPTTRLRRNRREDWSRRLVAETRLSVDDLIWPVFVQEGTNAAHARRVDARRRSPDGRPLRRGRQAGARSRHPGHRDLPRDRSPAKKTPDAREAYNPDGLVCRAITAAKKACAAGIGVVCDVALDPFNSDGHPTALCATAIVQNDRSLEALVKQAIVQAEAGADIQAPSDMMDGRIGAIRKALDAKGYHPRPDHVLRGQVRLGLLQSLPRRHRQLGRAQGRQEDLPDGLRQLRGGPARSRLSTSRKAPTW